FHLFSHGNDSCRELAGLKKLLSCHTEAHAGSLGQRASPPSTPEFRLLRVYLVGCEVPSAGDVASARAISELLLRIGPLSLAVVEADGFSRETVVGFRVAPGTDAGNENILQFDLHVLELVAARTTQLDRCIF